MKNSVSAFSLENLNVHQLKKKSINILYSIFRLVILLSIGFIIIYPLIYTIVTSLQSKYAFLNSTRVWIPTEFAIADHDTIIGSQKVYNLLKANNLNLKF